MSNPNLFIINVFGLPLYLYLLASLIKEALPYKKVKLTMYWVPYETEFLLGSDTPLKTCEGRVLANVSHIFADALRLEGSGVLRNGQVINLSYCHCGGNFSCFDLVTAPLGSSDNRLESYNSIAANDINFGKIVYIQEIDGWILPNGKRHNGCVRVDDTCFACSNDHIDFFVWNQTSYVNLITKYPVTTVNISVSKQCQLLDYEN